jgi:hypothetical protein
MTDGLFRGPVADPIVVLRLWQIGRLVDVLAARGLVDDHALLAVLTALVDGHPLTREHLRAIFGVGAIDALLDPAPAADAIGVGALKARARLRHALHHARRRSS